MANRRRHRRADPHARERARREQAEQVRAATVVVPPSSGAVPEPRSAEPKELTETRVKFTALLEPAIADRFERVTTDMRSVGRLAGGRYPSRADVLRAVLTLMDTDADLLARVRDQVRADLSSRADLSR